MDLQLEGKVALVTGGSRGIGKAIARGLAEEGVRVAICARTLEDVKSAVEEISRTTGQELLAVPGDVTKPGDIEAVVDRTAGTFGSLDILVSNAGVPGGKGFGPLEEVQDDLVMSDIETKFMGALRCARAAVPHMKRRGWGRIISVVGLSARYASSYASERNPEGSFNYSGGPRNLAVIHLMRTLSQELAGDGITANAVLPGATRTEDLDQMFERRARAAKQDVETARQAVARTGTIRRWVAAGEVADVVTFLASPRSSSISGEVLAASGGAGTGIFI